MLAVSAPLATIEQILAEEKLDLVLANRNAPTQAVLSGSTAEIDRAAAALPPAISPCKHLPVAAAFHSPLVADAAAPFLAALADIPFGKRHLFQFMPIPPPRPYPADPALPSELLAGQLARPVEFVAEIEAMYAAGITHLC